MPKIDINLHNETGEEELTIIHNRNGELIQQGVITVKDISSITLIDVQVGDTIEIA